MMPKKTKARFRGKLVTLVAAGIITLGVFAVAVASSNGAPGLSREGQAVADEQSQHEQEEAELIQSGRDALASGSVSEVPPPPSYSPDPWPVGIQGADQADIGVAGQFVNAWSQVVDGQYVAIYAGSDALDESVGLLTIQLIKDPRMMESTWEDYETPIPGPVKVKDAEGVRLTVVSLKDGSSTVFDFSTRTFS